MDQNNNLITLRQFEFSDVEFMVDALRSSDIARLTGLTATSCKEDVLAFIGKQAKRLQAGTGASFVVSTASAGKPVGQVGIFLDHDERASMGYWILPSARGRGFAVASLEAAAQYAFQSFRLERLELYIEPENSASLRVAERVGFAKEGLMRSWRRVDGVRRDMYMYSLLRLEHHP